MRCNASISKSFLNTLKLLLRKFSQGKFVASSSFHLVAYFPDRICMSFCNLLKKTAERNVCIVTCSIVVKR
jgi:hypothetical protein